MNETVSIDGRLWSWGVYRGARQHLFTTPLTYLQSLCDKAYAGDQGDVYRNSTRQKCKYCLAKLAAHEKEERR